MDSVGVQIHDARRAVGYSQAALAECLGVGQQVISKWERGITVPQDEHLTALRRTTVTEATFTLEPGTLVELETGGRELKGDTC